MATRARMSSKRYPENCLVRVGIRPPVIHLQGTLEEIQARQVPGLCYRITLLTSMNKLELSLVLQRHNMPSMGHRTAYWGTHRRARLPIKPVGGPNEQKNAF